MPRQSDLVTDSRLDTTFRGSSTIHTYREIDEAGNRFSRQEAWEQDGVLGNGGFGIVSLQKRASGGSEQLRVVKMIRKPSRSADYTRELEAVAKFSKRRFRLWFVQSFGWYENDEFFFITMEYCRLGDLQGYLDKRQRLRQSEVQILSSQIVEALAQMHENGFAHRDLKPANILIKSRPPERKWWVVLADFGITKRVDNSTELASRVVGTLAFMAPELLGCLRRDQPNPGRRSNPDFKAADMWAFGEIIFRMLTGEPTFITTLELVRYCEGREAFPSQRLPQSFDEHGRDCITRVMLASPQDRMSSAGCVKHNWLQTSIDTDLNIPSKNQTFLSRPRSSQLFDPNASARWSNLSIRDDCRQTGEIKRNDVILNRVELRSYNNANHTSTEETITAVIAPTSQAKMKPVAALKHSSHIQKYSFSPDSKRLACLTRDCTISVWDTGSWTQLYVKAAQKEGFQRIQTLINFSLDGRRLISRGALSVWHRDAETGKTLQKIDWLSLGLSLDEYDPRACSFDASPDGRYAAFCFSQNSNVQLKEIIPGILLELRGHRDIVCHVQFSPTGRQLLSFSADGEVRFWDVHTAKLNFVLDSCGHGPWSRLNIPSDGNHLTNYYYSSEKAYRLDSKRGKFCRYYWIWETASEQLPLTTQDWVDLPSCHDILAISADNRQVACGLGENRRVVQLRDIESGKTLWNYKTPSERRIWSASFSPDGKLLALTLHNVPGNVAANFMPQVLLLDSKTGKLVQRLRLPLVLSRLKDFVREAEYSSPSNKQPQFSADGKYVVAALKQNDLQVWTRDEDVLARSGTS